MAFVTVEDYSSSIEMLVFPKTLQKYGYLLTYDSAIAVSGTLSIREEEDVKLLCENHSIGFRRRVRCEREHPHAESGKIAEA